MPDPIIVLIALPEPLGESWLERLRSVSLRLRVEMRTTRSLADLGAQLSGVEVLLTSLDLPTSVLVPRLRWVQTYFAGVDGWMQRAGDRLKNIIVTTASGVHGPNMAEYGLMMMLAWAHELPPMLGYQRQGMWPVERRTLLSPGELRGATLGVVGYGSIGRETARQARALGMHVLACKRNPAERADTGWSWPGTGDPAGELPERIYPLDQLHVMLAECDYILLTLALTPATRHVIDGDALRHMKPTAVLVNVARGGLVDEPALIDALRSGVIRGAGLDVFEKEPLPADSPLWSLPNVLLTPHISGITTAYDERLTALFSENLRRYLASQPLLNQVDAQAGY